VATGQMRNENGGLGSDTGSFIVPVRIYWKERDQRSESGIRFDGGFLKD
jgi:hypothetical protein